MSVELDDGQDMTYILFMLIRITRKESRIANNHTDRTIFIFTTTSLQSMVLDECNRLVGESTEKLQSKVEEQNSEIRKLKAMIGKKHLSNMEENNWHLLKPLNFSETRDPDPDPGDQEQGAREDADQQRADAQ